MKGTAQLQWKQMRTSFRWKNNNMSVFFIHVAWVLSEETAKISSCSVSVFLGGVIFCFDFDVYCHLFFVIWKLIIGQLM